MQPFPVEYEPDLFKPCLSIRSRREQNTRDTVNARHVEQWLSDPTFLGNLSLDTQGLSSRLYRESLDRHPQYVEPALTETELTKKVTLSLARIQHMESRIRTLDAGPDMDAAVKALKEEYSLYKAIVEAKKVELIDSFTQNPYFDKYNVASDSRNVARELRGVIYENIQDRGVEESKKLLGRAFENRLFPSDRQEVGLGRVEAFELLRPTITQMNKTYNF